MEEDDRSLLFQNIRDEVVLPHRDTPRQKQHIVLETFPHRSPELIFAVRSDPHIFRPASCSLHQGEEHGTVAVADLSVRWELCGINDLVPRWEHPDRRYLDHLKRRLSYRCAYRHLGSSDEAAPLEHDLSLPNVFTPFRHVLTGGNGSAELDHPLLRTGGILHLHDRIGALRYDASGHYLHAGSRRDRQVGERSSRDGTAEGERGRCGFHILAPHRISVHGGPVEGREVGIRVHVLVDNPSVR